MFFNHKSLWQVTYSVGPGTESKQRALNHFEAAPISKVLEALILILSQISNDNEQVPPIHLHHTEEACCLLCRR